MYAPPCTRWGSRRVGDDGRLWGRAVDLCLFITYVQTNPPPVTAHGRRAHTQTNHFHSAHSHSAPILGPTLAHKTFSLFSRRPNALRVCLRALAPAPKHTATAAAAAAAAVDIIVAKQRVFPIFGGRGVRAHE